MNLKWFTSGLTKEQLANEYRYLAKTWHPDICKDPNATKFMAEINAEYDKYFEITRFAETGYNTYDIRERYRAAKDKPEIVLLYLRKDKMSANGGFFTFNEDGKVTTDGSSSWDNFRGGFALCNLKKKTKRVKVDSFWFDTWEDVVESQTVTKIPASIKTPLYADMYFAMMYKNAVEDDNGQLVSTEQGKQAFINRYANYELISVEKVGMMWVSFTKDKHGMRRAYMKVNGQVMDCPFKLDEKYYKKLESVYANDFGFLAFQDCLESDFLEGFDVDYTPRFVDAVKCKRLISSDLYWIKDPIVGHFARAGILEFYQSEINFKMRYGKFNKTMLEDNLEALSKEDADIIQDFLDELNGKFDAWISGLIKKGKIKVKVNTSSPFSY